MGRPALPAFFFSGAMNRINRAEFIPASASAAFPESRAGAMNRNLSLVILSEFPRHIAMLPANVGSP
jgi:hypothetical protein